MTGTTKGDSKNQVQGSTKEVNFIVTFIAIFTAVVSKDGRVHAHKCNQSGEIVDDTHLNYFGEKVNSSWPRVTGTSLTDPGQKADFWMSVDSNGRYYGSVYEAGTNIPALRHHNIVKVWAKPGVGPATPPIVVYTVEERHSTATSPAPAAGLSLPSGEGIASGSKATPSGGDSASGSKVAAKKKRKTEDASLEEENLPKNRGEGKRRRLQSRKGKEAAESQQLMRNWTDKGKETASPSPRRRPVPRRSAPRPQQQQQAPQPDLDRRNSLDTLVLVASVECVELSEEEPSDEETEAATILAEMSD
jgi:hypothetical protein